MSRLESEDLAALREVAADVLGESASSSRIRAVMAAQGTPDRALLTQYAQLGWLGMEATEDFGGAGASLAEIVVVSEEVGSTAASDAVIASAALCIGVIQLGGSVEQQGRWLPALASGEQFGSVVLPGIFGPDPTAAEGVRATPETGGWRLGGSAAYVPNARIANLFVVAARADSGDVIVAVPATTTGFAVTPVPMLDSTRCLDAVRFDDVTVADSDVLTDDPLAAARLLEALVNRAAVVIAADAVGVARRVLDMTVTYAQQREQFGRQIGSFQAVKHQAANMLVDLETSSELVGFATAVVAKDPSSREASIAASMAKEYACDKAALATGTALQLHGGIGYTWEHDLHIFFKRAKLDEQLFGNGRWHRQRLANHLLDDASGVL
jgi:alkylation response protein AidB-like acyl-CoA dehydrogenase